MSVRVLSPIVPVAALLAFAGAATAAPSPFLRAEAEQRGNEYVLAWKAKTRDVSVYATRRADGMGPGRRVGEGGPRDTVRIRGLQGRHRWYFRLQADDGRFVVIADRSLHLASAPNARDLGSYRTEDGQWLRASALIRSSSLSALTDADQAALVDLGIRTDVDLRTEEERARQPDRVPPTWRLVDADMLGPDGERDLGRTPTPKELVAEEKRVYREQLVAAPTARRALKTLVETAAARGTRPLVFHDSGGVNRAGWAAYVLLRVLGVSDRTAVADYLQSNRYLPQLLDQALDLAPPQLHPYLRLKIKTGGAKLEYLRAATREASRRYGSFQGYVRKGIGLSDADVALLRGALLHPAEGRAMLQARHGCSTRRARVRERGAHCDPIEGLVASAEASAR